MEIVLKIDNLIKSYGNNMVIKSLSLDVRKGEIFGLLGVNGAGKTTTLECIEGLRQYDSGTIHIQGKLGVQLQSSSLPGKLKAMEAINLFSKWSKVPIDLDLIHLLGIDEFRNKLYENMSTGQKRRLHLALSLIGDPDILILDEPTAGLDVEGRVSLHQEIRKLKARGKTIIMASHDMAEVESLCDRIAILKGGKIAFLGTANELTRSLGEKVHISIKTSDLLEIGDLSNSTYHGKKIEYYLFESESINQALLEILNMAEEQEISILDIKIGGSNLEEEFMNIAKEV